MIKILSSQNILCDQEANQSAGHQIVTTTFFVCCKQNQTYPEHVTSCSVFTILMEPCIQQMRLKYIKTMDFVERRLIPTSKMNMDPLTHNAYFGPFGGTENIGLYNWLYSTLNQFESSPNVEVENIYQLLLTSCSISHMSHPMMLYSFDRTWAEIKS